MKKVIIGLSGGVDSSVAAYLLKNQGFDVHAVYMINWHDTDGVLASGCTMEDDIIVAKLVAKKLNIPLEIVDFSRTYRTKVVDYMFHEYQAGRTPNPDVLCNREIKFDLFLKKALEMGADYVATGHYCRKEILKEEKQTIYRLLAGKDKQKDQSYFLCSLSQQQLEKAIFPIGDLEKSKVREIAERIEIASAKKKDSQGICFVGKVDLPVFLQQKLKVKKGDIVLIPPDSPLFETKSDNDDALETMVAPFLYLPEHGTPKGIHDGAHFYTIGQRKGLGIGGLKEPAFVIGIDVERNIVYVGEGKKHPGLFRKGLFIKKEHLHWVRPDLALKDGERLKITARIRYRQALQEAEIFAREEGMYMIFEQMQRGITPGQFAAFYLEDELIGSGIIQ